MLETKRKRILFIGDMHVGSTFGVWKPDYKTKQGITFNINGMQSSLWEYWQFMCQELKEDPPLYAILMGDLVDGVQRSETGRTCLTTDLDDQANCAIELLRMVPLQKKRYFTVVGTSYHEAQYNQSHFQICQELNNNDGNFWLNTMGYVIEGDYIINVSHGDTAAFVYPETQMARQRNFMLAAAELKKIDKPCDLISRGHLHSYNSNEVSGFRLKTFPGLQAPAVTSIKTLICPAWQGQTDFMQRKEPFKLIPDIGYVTISIDEHGVHVKERIFEHLGIRTVTREPDKIWEKNNV